MTRLRAEEGLIGVTTQLVASTVFHITEKIVTLTRTFKGNICRTNSAEVFQADYISVTKFNVDRGNDFNCTVLSIELDRLSTVFNETCRIRRVVHTEGSLFCHQIRPVAGVNKDHYVVIKTFSNSLRDCSLDNSKAKGRRRSWSKGICFPQIVNASIDTEK